MKKLILTIVALATLALSSFGQPPEGFKYQSVIRDAGTVLNNQSVGVQMTIKQGSIGGTAVYTETFAPTSNDYGLVNLEIGTGTSTDDFTAIDWSAGPYFIETAVDVTGGTSYVIMGTSQLMSVPYSLYAKKAGNGITSAQANYITANTAKVGLTTEQATVLSNTSNTNTGDQDISGITTNAGDITSLETEQTTQNTAIALNTVKTGITSAQANYITANTAKVGLTTEQSTVLSNTSNTNTGDQDISGITTNAGDITSLETEQTTQNTAIALNTAKTGITTAQANEITSNATLIAALEARIAALEPAVIGDFRDGGIVFWVDPNDNTHGLVCAIEDQSTGIQWYNGSNTTTGATGTAIGTGQANTTAIITAQGATETDYAAGLAKAYRGGGFDDWFLPSKDALNEMYLNKATINTTAIANSGSGFANNSYWSSTEIDYYLVWLQGFISGSQFNYNKFDTYRVRAVRAF